MTPILKIFAPNARSPPSAKNRHWISKTAVSVTTAGAPPSSPASRIPPPICPLEPVPGSKLAEAVTYAKNQKPYLNAFLDHGEVDISNNFAENAIRPFVVGRKGWLFCDSPKGADSSAIVYTLVETAKANGLDPYRYLERSLTELPYLGKNPKQEYLDAFMPWSSAMQRTCSFPAAELSAGGL